MIKGFRSVLLGCLVVLVPIATAGAQPSDDSLSTRRAQLRMLRMEKAEHLRPPDPPGRFQRFLARIQDRIDRSNVARSRGDGTGVGWAGFRPTLGGLKSGAGIAGGIVFEPFEGRDAVLFRAELLASRERYWGAGVRGGFRAGRATVLGYARYRHMPREDFYGFGGASDLEDRSNYRLNEAVGGALLRWRVGNFISSGVRTSYVLSSPGPGKDANYPNTLSWALPEAIPSLERTARHVAFGTWLELEWRDPQPARRAFVYLTHTEPDLARMPLATYRGMHALVDVVHYAAINDTPFDFTRLTVQSQQYLPFRHGRNVFAFREYLSLSRTDGGSVPVYMLPALGGAYSLRGYDLFRFRDRHALMFNAEYRWHVWLFADLALFLDAGQVYARTDEIAVDDLHTSYGVGLRLRTRGRGIARADFARSVEGTQLHLRLSAYF